MSFLVAIDFDGTIAEHRFPEIGPAVPGAFFWIKKFQEAGANIALWTMRGRRNGLYDAIEFCRQNGVVFDLVNEQNPLASWAEGPKLYCQSYIDDNAAGCPLITLDDGSFYVDWEAIGPGVLKRILEWD